MLVLRAHSLQYGKCADGYVHGVHVGIICRLVRLRSQGGRGFRSSQSLSSRNLLLDILTGSDEGKTRPVESLSSETRKGQHGSRYVKVRKS